jgi:hypothetical protein
MVLLGDEAQIEARFGPFEDSVSFIEVRCTVCTKCTIASEIVFGAVDGSPR